MTSKALLAATALVAITLSLPATAAELTVGFSQIGSESGWRAAETSVSKTEAAKRKVTLKFADAQQKQENQIKAIRGFIAQGVDAILVAPVVVDRLGRGAERGQGSQDSRRAAGPRHRSAGQGSLSDPVASDSVHEGARCRRMAGRRPWATRHARSSSCRAPSASSAAINRKKGFDSASPRTPTSRSCAARPATSPAPRARK